MAVARPQGVEILQLARMVHAGLLVHPGQEAPVHVSARLSR